MNLNLLRKQHHYNQTTLAKLINVDQTTVSKWENKQAVPSLSNMRKLAEVLEVDLQTIVDCFVDKEVNEK